MPDLRTVPASRRAAAGVVPRRLRRALLGLPAVVLFGSYAAVSSFAGTAWPWSAPVHEDGVRTLLGTVLYFEHAMRELPLDLVLGVVVGGSALACRPVRRSARPRRGAWAAGALACTGLIVVGSLAAAGPEGTLLELLQSHTRRGGPTDYGSHWHYHLLSRAALLLLAQGGLAWACRAEGAGRGPLLPLLGGWIAFGLLTVVFAPRAEPFFEPRHLGHQARELVTHAAVTLPLACATVLGLAGEAARGGGRPLRAAPALAGAVLIGTYLGAGVLLTGAAGHGQTDAFVPLVFSHVFEHAPGYLLVPLVAGAVYLAGARGPDGGSSAA